MRREEKRVKERRGVLFSILDIMIGLCLLEVGPLELATETKMC
jgi:hypothetical protein